MASVASSKGSSKREEKLITFHDEEGSDDDDDHYSTGSENDAVDWLQGFWDDKGLFHLKQDDEDESSTAELHRSQTSSDSSTINSASYKRKKPRRMFPSKRRPRGGAGKKRGGNLSALLERNNKNNNNNVNSNSNNNNNSKDGIMFRYNDPGSVDGSTFAPSVMELGGSGSALVRSRALTPPPEEEQVEQFHDEIASTTSSRNSKNDPHKYMENLANDATRERKRSRRRAVFATAACVVLIVGAIVLLSYVVLRFSGGEEDDGSMPANNNNNNTESPSFVASSASPSFVATASPSMATAIPTITTNVPTSLRTLTPVLPPNVMSGPGGDDETASPSLAPSAPAQDEQWVEIGQPILGTHVSISGNSRIMAILSTSHIIQAYRWTNAVWETLGQALDVSTAAAANNNMVPFALSRDGNTLAVADIQAVRVYRRTTDAQWDPIDGGVGVSASPFITSVHLSEDGNVLAVASNDTVRIDRYQSDSDTWVIVGQEFHPARFVALNANGDMAAIGQGSGLVRVYVLDNDSWIPVGTGSIQSDSIATASTSNVFGSSMAVSDDGNILAIGGTNQVRVMTFVSNQWTQLGPSFEALPSGVSTTVSLSSDGLFLAVGGQGSARLYRYDASDGGSWDSQLDAQGGAGQVVLSLSSSGKTLALSSGGQVVVIGHPTDSLLLPNNPSLPPAAVSDQDQQTLPPSSSILVSLLNWTMLGSDETFGNIPLDSDVVHSDIHPQSSAISGEGNLVAVADGGSLRVLHFQNDRWKTLLDGPRGAVLASDEIVVAVAISNDGGTVAFGTVQQQSSTVQTGKVRVIAFDTQGNWNWLGQPITSSSATAIISSRTDSDINIPLLSLSVSDGGRNLAVGSPFFNDGRGVATVYGYNTLTSWWLPQGQSIQGSNTGEWFGTSIHLSSNGNTLVVGAPGYNEETGLVRVYRYESNGWAALGPPFTGNINQKSRLGYTVALSGAGSRLAIGAAPGEVSLYEWTDNTDWTLLLRNIDSGDAVAVALSSDGTTLAAGGSTRVHVFSEGTVSWLMIGDFDAATFSFVSLSIDGAIVAMGGASQNQKSLFVRVLQQTKPDQRDIS